MINSVDDISNLSDENLQKEFSAAITAVDYNDADTIRWMVALADERWHRLIEKMIERGEV